MPDQRPIWEAIYQQAQPHAGSIGASDFARHVGALLSKPVRVLEIGCGTGEDAAWFASQGHDVLATDLAPSAVERARRYEASDLRLRFEQHDCSQPFACPEGAFDLIYARLSLHYFTDGTTKAVFRELRRLLARGGLLAFMCKSTDDVLYGLGTQIEPDMFDHHHVRHFFSEAYARECVEGFVIESLDSRRDELYGRESAYVAVLARSIRQD